MKNFKIKMLLKKLKSFILFQLQKFFPKKKVAKPKPKLSSPIIIGIENTTDSDIKDVIIIDSALRLDENDIDGILITYEIPGISYRQFLRAINSGIKVKIGLIRIVSNTQTFNYDQQMDIIMTMSQKDIFGCESQQPFQLQQFVDEYQVLKNIVDIYCVFTINALTALKFSSIFAKTKIKIYLFPIEVEQ